MSLLKRKPYRSPIIMRNNNHSNSLKSNTMEHNVSNSNSKPSIRRKIYLEGDDDDDDDDDDNENTPIEMTSTSSPLAYSIHSNITSRRGSSRRKESAAAGSSSSRYQRQSQIQSRQSRQASLPARQYEIYKDDSIQNSQTSQSKSKSNSKSTSKEINTSIASMASSSKNSNTNNSSRRKSLRLANKQQFTTKSSSSMAYSLSPSIKSSRSSPYQSPYLVHPTTNSNNGIHSGEKDTTTDHHIQSIHYADDDHDDNDLDISSSSSIKRLQLSLSPSIASPKQPQQQPQQQQQQQQPQQPQQPPHHQNQNHHSNRKNGRTPLSPLPTTNNGNTDHLKPKSGKKVNGRGREGSLLLKRKRDTYTNGGSATKSPKNSSSALKQQKRRKQGSHSKSGNKRDIMTKILNDSMNDSVGNNSRRGSDIITHILDQSMKNDGSMEKMKISHAPITSVEQYAPSQNVQDMKKKIENNEEDNGNEDENKLEKKQLFQKITVSFPMDENVKQQTDGEAKEDMSSISTTSTKNHDYLEPNSLRHVYNHAMDHGTHQRQLKESGCNLLSLDEVIIPTIMMSKTKTLRTMIGKARGKKDLDQVNQLQFMRSIVMSCSTNVSHQIVSYRMKHKTEREEKRIEQKNMILHQRAEERKQRKERKKREKMMERERRRKERRKNHPKNKELWREVMVLMTDLTRLEKEEKMWKSIDVETLINDSNCGTIFSTTTAESITAVSEEEGGKMDNCDLELNQNMIDVVDDVALATNRINESLSSISNLMAESNNIRSEMNEMYKRDHKFHGYLGVKDPKALIRGLAL